MCAHNNSTITMEVAATTQDQRQNGVSESNSGSNSSSVCFCQNFRLTDDPQEECNCQLRRELRAKQRETLQDIKGDTMALKLEANKEDGKTTGNIQIGVLQVARERNNKLFRRVRHTRELKIDADILNARAEMSVKQAQHLHQVCWH